MALNRRLAGKAMGSVLLQVLCWCASSACQACWYDDPDSIQLQRGLLERSYADASYVLGALSQAQLSKTISVVKLPSPLAMLKTAAALRQFMGLLHARIGVDPAAGVALLLIDPMLWTRYALQDGQTRMQAHLTEPERQDTVIVTTEAALWAITDRRLSAGQAQMLGLLRIYGDQQVFEFSSPADAAIPTFNFKERPL